MSFRETVDGQAETVSAEQPVAMSHIETSFSTKLTLTVLGSFFLLVVLRVVWKLVRAISKSRPAAPPKRKPAAIPAHLQLKSSQPAKAAADQQQKGSASLKHLVKQSKQQARGGAVGADAGSHHPLYLNCLKGHSDVVNGLAWSPDAQQVATACEDRTVRVFKLADVTSSSINVRRKNLTRGPVDVAFGASDSQLLVLTKGSLDAASLLMLNSGASDFASAWEIESAHGGGAAVTLSGASNGVFATCGAKTDMKVFSASGKQLAALDSNGLCNHGVALSHNGQFMAAASFTSDVKIYELQYDRSGSFKAAKKMMDLKGHKRQIQCVAFSPDATRAVTCSHDFSFRVWKVNVRYEVGEDAKCLVNVQQQLPQGRFYTKVEFGAHGIIAAAFDRTLHFISSTSGDLLQSIEDAHSSEISYMQWSPVPRQIGGESSYLLATAGADRSGVRIWRSV